MNNQEVIDRILKEGLIVIVRGIKNEHLIPMAEAMYRGGVRVLEVTYAADGSIPEEATQEGIRALKAHFGDRMSIGAGTVLSTHQVDLTREAGGEFIISPDVNPEVIAYTKEQGLVSIPGALTPTEAQTAHLAGADFVKLFPVTALGAEYVKAIRAPLSHIRFLAVGGVNENNMRDYLDAGACGIGVATAIVDKDAIARGDYDAITELAKRYTSRI
jgi:2-dehydro-3-deoxyphosphogluconate aldolase/(4S)-4-hydroxy-2-oxoglutarate aldolase